jgi:ABC-type Mn2+/Zn2+ transport system permease subunit
MGGWKMLTLIGEILSYPFMVRALIVGVLISICASMLGVSLVLKRYSMIGDGLSHVGFGAMALSAAMNVAPLAVAIPVVAITAILLLRVGENSKLKGDAAIAIISTGSLAFGVTVVSIHSGMNVDLYNYMFGSILAMTRSDVIIGIILSVVVIGLYSFFYDKIFAVTFDETFAKATGTKAGVYNTLLSVLTAITVVLGMRMMGALLISSLIIFPALTAMRITKSFRGVLIGSVILSVVGFVFGITVSFLYAVPTGASIVLMDMFLFFLFAGINGIKNIKK